jgi:deoxyribonuclease-4
MRFGAHVSSAGSLALAPARAAEWELETFQMFSRPPQGGRAKPVTEDQAEEFKAAMRQHGFADFYIHAPYIINLASTEARIRSNSIEILRDELIRANALGARAIMFHPGSATSVGSSEVGERMVMDGIKEIMRGYRGDAVFCVEVSAGAGMVIGARFDAVGRILKGAAHPKLGCCLDTAHVFASGYDLRTPEAVKATMDEFDEHVGLSNLVLSHLNDSKVELGARKDRHEHIGYGHIGVAGFEAMFAHPAFQAIDLILETEYDKITDDIRLIKELRERIVE